MLQIAPDSKGKPNVSLQCTSVQKMITAEPLVYFRVFQVKAPTSSRGTAHDRKATHVNEAESLDFLQQPVHPQPQKSTSISKAELMALGKDEEDGLIKCTKIATSNPFSLSVMSV